MARYAVIWTWKLLSRRFLYSITHSYRPVIIGMHRAIPFLTKCETQIPTRSSMEKDYKIFFPTSISLKEFQPVRQEIPGDVRELPSLFDIPLYFLNICCKVISSVSFFFNFVLPLACTCSKTPRGKEYRRS